MAVEAEDQLAETTEEQEESTEDKKVIPYQRFSEVNEAKKKAEAELRKAKDALKRYDGVDPDRYAELTKAAEDAEAQKLQTEGKWEEMRERLTATHQKKLDEVKAELERDRQFIREIMVEKELISAIQAVGVIPDDVEVVQAWLEKRKPTVVSEDGKYRGVFETDMGQVPIREFVEEWAKSDHAARYLPPLNVQGSPEQRGRNKGGGGGVTSKADLKTPRDKAAYIGKHGREVYLDLPDS
jgi:hypothetical protein